MDGDMVKFRRRISALSLILIVGTLAGCTNAPKAGPEMGDESRPAAVATATAATDVVADNGGFIPTATRTLDICNVEPIGSISNPNAPVRYSCDIHRVALLAFPPAVPALEAASLIEQVFTSRSCSVPAPLVTPASQPALEALDADSDAPLVQGGYDCSGDYVRASFGRADNAKIRGLAETLPAPLTYTVVSEEPPIGTAPLDDVLDSDAVFVAYIHTKVNYVHVLVCGGLCLCQ